MLRQINKLFQKTLCSKTGKTEVGKTDSRGLKMAGKGDSCGGRISGSADSHGRSMVEMLGVLAIAGILSIGALAGYRYAMDKQRANTTINDINLRGVDLVIQASRNIPLNLDEWSTSSTAGYAFGKPEYTVDGFVKLPISGLPKRVCEMAVEDLSEQFDLDVGADRYAGDTSLCAENNTLTVYFDSAGQGNKVPTDACSGCPGKQTCVDGACVCTNGGIGENCEIDPCSGVSCGECQECQAGTCVTKADYTPCSNGYCEMGFCVSHEKPATEESCTTSEDSETTTWLEETETETQSPDEGCSATAPLKSIYPDDGCYSCFYQDGLIAENCLSICPNRIINKSGYCALPSCPTGMVHDCYGDCRSCDESEKWPVCFDDEIDDCITGCSREVEDDYYCVLPSIPEWEETIPE